MLLLLVLIFLAMAGHVLLWAEVVNRSHGFGLRRRWIKASLLLVAAIAVGIPLAYCVVLARNGWGAVLPDSWSELLRPASLYLVVCWAAVAVAAVRVVHERWLRRPPSALRHHRENLIDLAGGTDVAEHEHHFLVRMPGNESLQLDVAERALELARLPECLEGLTVMHLSDLHFTGRVGKAYFDQVVRLANETEPDLVVITGDLADVNECIDWIPDTLGRLRSRWGSYFVLGNHDLLIDTVRLRRTMVDSGLTDLGNRWLEVPVRETSVVLVGDELPWIKPGPDLGDAPPPAPRGPLRIVLTHTPDQLGWARRHEADLLVAGHLHGGQIRLPLLGALLSPSRASVKYAQAGVFHAPPTVMHVSRGVSGMYPIRLNCPPEIVRLVLHAPAHG